MINTLITSLIFCSYAVLLAISHFPYPLLSMPHNLHYDIITILPHSPLLPYRRNHISNNTTFPIPTLFGFLPHSQILHLSSPLLLLPLPRNHLQPSYLFLNMPLLVSFSSSSFDHTPSTPLPLPFLSPPSPLPPLSSLSPPLPLPSPSYSSPLPLPSPPSPLPSLSPPLPLPSPPSPLPSPPLPLPSPPSPLPSLSTPSPLPLPSYSSPLPLISFSLPSHLTLHFHSPPSTLPFPSPPSPLPLPTLSPPLTLH